MADTPMGETVTPGDSQTTVPTPTAPVANVSDPAEVERLRKESEQKDLRIRQLENERIAREKADTEAKAKQLEENEQFKELWQKSEAEKQALLSQNEEARRKAELESRTNTLLGEYSPTVQELARTAGLSLSDETDEAKAQLKATLDTFASKVPAAKVEANNPPPTAAATPDREEAISVMRMNNIPNSAKQAATKRAIGSLESMKTLRANAGVAEPTTQ